MSTLALAMWTPQAVRAESVALRDIAYGGAAYQTFDLFYNEARTNAPVIILLHGRNGSKTDWQPFMGLFQDMGMVVVTPQYNTDRAPVDDMQTMYEWVAGNVAQYGGNPTKINLAGSSEGTYVGATLAYCRKLPVNSFLGLAGIYLSDIVIDDVREVPIASVTAGDPPAFLCHGDADPKVGDESSIHFDEELTANAIESHLYILPGVGHSDAKAAVFGDPDNQFIRDDLTKFLRRVNSDWWIRLQD